MRLWFVFLALAICFASGTSSSAAKLLPMYDVCDGKKPALAVDKAGHLHAAFQAPQKDNDVTDIFYTESSDGGKTWSTPTDVSKTPGNSFDPDIVVEQNGAVDVAWSDTTPGEKIADIYFARSADGGKTWSAPIQVSSTPGQSTHPALAAGEDSSLHLVWCDTTRGEKNQDIFYVASYDGGRKWGKEGAAEDISNTPGTSSDPVIAISADGITHVAWLDSTPGEDHPDIYYCHCASEHWSKPLNISNSPRRSSHPGIACGAQKKIYLCWSDNSRKENSADIWCAIWDRRGEFGKPLNISDTLGVSSQPAIAASGQSVACVWSDSTKYMRTTTKNPDIFCRISSDGGQEFSNVLDVASTPGVSQHADVAIAGSKVYVIWEEVDDAKSSLKSSMLDLKDLASGVIQKVDPTIHMHR
jgi:hypothetical protein